MGRKEHRFQYGKELKKNNKQSDLYFLKECSVCCMKNGLEKDKIKCMECRRLLQKSRGKIMMAGSRMVPQMKEVVWNWEIFWNLRGL